MSIIWDRHKRRVFRLALQRVYPSYEELDLFIDEAIDENLADITGDKRLPIAINYLLRWAQGKTGKLDELFESFCDDHSEDEVIPLIKTAKSIVSEIDVAAQKVLGKQDWDSLFLCFNEGDFEGDFLELKRAFQAVGNLLVNPKFRNSIRSATPFGDPPTSVLEMRGKLEKWDSPDLAFWFVSGALKELSRSYPNGERDLTPLGNWKAQLSQKYELSEIADTEKTLSAGYLIVAVQETGRTRKGITEVILYPELHIDPFSMSEQVSSPDTIALLNQETMEPIKCKLSEVGTFLSRLLHRAEDKLAPYCGQVTLELFLKWPQIEEDTANWDAEDRDQNAFKFKYQRYLIRSLDRFVSFREKQALMSRLEQKWKALEESVTNQSPYEKFHVQDACPEPGQLLALLSNSTGLTLAAKLPEDKNHRKAVFSNIINSAVPIAVWAENTACPPQTIRETIEAVFAGSCFTRFDSVADYWMQSRGKLNNDEVACGLRALFDCPTRWPTSLPNTASDIAEAKSAQSSEIIAADEDLIVAP